MSAIRGKKIRLERVIKVGELEPLTNDLVLNTNKYDPEIVLTEWQIDLKKVLDSLSERERGVIEMRFGLNDGIPKTLDEIARVHGVTRERIKKIESITLEKLSVRTDIEKNFADFPTLS